MASIISLGLQITYQCNAACAHCAYHCGPAGDGLLEARQVRRLLRDASALPLALVCISGGEPFLRYRTLLATVEATAQLTQADVWVFTNGYWATTPDVARAKLRELQRRGLAHLHLGVDSFHQPFVPSRRVWNAIQAARWLGMMTTLAVSLLRPSNATNSADRATRELLRSLGDLGDVAVEESPLRYIGRAAEQLAPGQAQLPATSGWRCPGAWAWGTIPNPGGVDVDPYGNITICPGISIGNVHRKSLSRTLEEYDYRRIPILRALAEDGPAGLLTLAQAAGYSPRAAYADACHMCYDVRRFLRAGEAQCLQPLICYEERIAAGGSPSQ